MATAPLPPTNVPFLGDDNQPTLPWRRWLQQKVGTADLTPAQIVAIEAAIAAAQATANQALAEAQLALSEIPTVGPTFADLLGVPGLDFTLKAGTNITLNAQSGVTLPGQGPITIAATGGAGTTAPIILGWDGLDGEDGAGPPGGGGTVTSVAATSPISVSPSPITGTGTISLVAGALPNGMTATTHAASDNSTKVATDAYVTTAIANAIAGVNPAIAVQAATTAVLPNTPTYNNGVSGIGATLTAGVTNTTLVVDGYTPALLERILVKNQASAFQNGVYYVSQLAALGLAWVLTRALDYDQPSDINNTGAIPVVNGTANAATQWVLTSSVTTVGTDSLTYTQFTIAPANTLQTGGTNPTNHALLLGKGTNVVGSLGALTNGQLAIGSTGADPVPATLTAGTGISITNASGSITVTNIGSGGTGATVLISEVVTSGSQASVTFSSIATTWRDLIVVVRGRGDTAANTATIQIQFNGDTGNNYNIIDNTHTGSADSSGSATGTGTAQMGLIPAANATANYAGIAKARIGDYRGTIFNKIFTAEHNAFYGSAVSQIFGQFGGAWNSTAAINAVKVFLSAGNFVNNSVVSLYGSF